METASNTRWTVGRILACSGVLTSVLVAVPILIEDHHQYWRFLGWSGLFLAFVLTFWRSTWFLDSAVAPALSAVILRLAIQLVCVMGIVLFLCDGFEGSLLVLIAMQLGLYLPRRVGVIWVLLQSALLLVCISIHWSLRPAVMLTPPYLGFQLLGLFAVGMLASETKARLALANANEELRAAQALLEENSRMAERVRISRELHDVMGHYLVALSLNIEAAVHLAQAKTSSTELQPIETARGIVKHLLGELREVVTQTQDRREISLIGRLKSLASAIPSPQVHLDIPPHLRISDSEHEHILLRCTQEIITNAAKHAHARDLWIRFEQAESGITIRAHDDGGGSTSVADGNGLRSMRERLEKAGGRLEVDADSGSGFSLVAELPCR